MFCLVYKSVANPNFGVSQIHEMLEKARKFNAKHNITGCLLFYNGHFIQYIEGNHLKVLELFDRIQNDSRHSNLELLAHENIEVREFDDWTMAFENLWGENSYLQYLKLIVSSFIEDPEPSLNPSPTSRKFWGATKLLLESKRNHQKGLYK